MTQARESLPTPAAKGSSRLRRSHMLQRLVEWLALVPAASLAPILVSYLSQADHPDGGFAAAIGHGELILLSVPVTLSTLPGLVHHFSKIRGPQSSLAQSFLLSVNILVTLISSAMYADIVLASGTSEPMGSQPMGSQVVVFSILIYISAVIVGACSRALSGLEE